METDILWRIPIQDLPNPAYTQTWCTFFLLLSPPWATQLSLSYLILLKNQKLSHVAPETPQVFWQNLSLLPRGWSTAQKNAVVAIFWAFGRVRNEYFRWWLDYTPGKWGTCALESCLFWESIPPMDLLSGITCLWDYTESHVGRQGKAALPLQLNGQGDFFGRWTVSPCLGLFLWR